LLRLTAGADPSGSGLFLSLKALIAEITDLAEI
jgi:hypothetical protein